MAESLGSWLVNAIIQHDREFGANLDTHWMGSRYCQLIQFDTYRTPEQPHARVSGRICDQTHLVRVTFDVAATDKHEEATPDIPAETLTSHLRAVFRLLKFRFHLLPFHHTSGLEVPRVVLDILEWEVHSGDRNDPVFYDTQEIGAAASDVEVQNVLRKWWFGESYSEPSLPGPSAAHHMQALAGPSTPFKNPPLNNKDNDTRTALSDFLHPYLNPLEGKKPKPIPEWIFEFPDEAKRQLDTVAVFGLDLASLDASNSHHISPSGIASSRKGKARQVTPSIPLPPAGQATNPDAFVTPLSPSGDDWQTAETRGDKSDSEDEDIPLKPRPLEKQPERRALDPLSFQDSSQASAEDRSANHTEGEGDEDEDGLSDYERERLRLQVNHGIKRSSGEDSGEIKVTVTVQKSVSFADLETASQSLPESQRTAEDFSLSRYVDCSAPTELSEGEGAESPILVNDSDQSRVKGNGTQNQSQSFPQPGPGQSTPGDGSRSTIPMSGQVRTPTAAQAAIAAEAHAEDKPSQDSTSKSVRISPPSLSMLAYLNPLSYIRSASRQVEMKSERESPAQSKKRSATEEEHASPLSRSDADNLKAKKARQSSTFSTHTPPQDGVSRDLRYQINTGGDCEPSTHSEAQSPVKTASNDRTQSDFHKFTSPRRVKSCTQQASVPPSQLSSVSKKSEVFVRVTRTAARPGQVDSTSRQSPSLVVKERYNLQPASEVSHTGRPLGGQIDDGRPRLAMKSSPTIIRPKLGGFRPDLVPVNGLSEKWVVAMTKVAKDYRIAKTARTKKA